MSLVSPRAPDPDSGWWAGTESDPTPDPTTFRVRARLAAGTNSATLLRLVSILHSRCAQVRMLAFDGEGPGGPTLTAVVTLKNTGGRALRELLARPVEVVEVQLSAAGRNTGGTLHGCTVTSRHTSAMT